MLLLYSFLTSPTTNLFLSNFGNHAKAPILPEPPTESDIRSKTMVHEHESVRKTQAHDVRYHVCNNFNYFGQACNLLWKSLLETTCEQYKHLCIPVKLQFTFLVPELKKLDTMDLDLRRTIGKMLKE